MVDPIGITAGVLGVAMSALHSARRLKELIDGIQGAPEAVRALSKDLHALQDVLEALNNLLEDTRFTGGRGRAKAMPALEPHLNNCTVTLNSLFLAIARHTKTSGDPKKSKWSGFIWYFREKEVLTLQNRLTTYKMSLDLAVSVANLTNSSTGFSEIRKSIRGMRKRIEKDRESVEDSSFMGSSLAGSDYGFAMKQWLRETESIIGDYSPCVQPDTVPTEVDTHHSRRSSGSLSDPTSSYSNPFDENVGLISSPRSKEEASTGGSTNSNLHWSSSAIFKTTTREVNQTTSSHAAHAPELRRPLDKQDPFASPTITDEAGITQNDEHEFARPSGQDASLDSESEKSTERSLLQKLQSPPASRARWDDARYVDYEGNDYVDNDSNHLKPPPAPAPSLSLDSLARRDAVLVPNFVKDCIWMLDIHGLHLPEAFGDGEVSDELNQLRAFLGGDVPLELGLVMDINWVHPTQEQLIKIRALLRYFFKSLAEPLFTRAFYDTIVAAAGECTKHIITVLLTKNLAPEPVYSQYHILRDFIPRLAPAHYETAKHLVMHLHRVCQQRSVQRMGNKKLASAWAKILLPHDLFPTPDEREHQELLLQTMILRAPTLFRD